MHNIVILSSLGGNDVVSRAIKEQFDLRYKDCKAIIIPMEEYAGKTLTVNNGFLTFCCRYAQWLFGIYYKLTAARLTRKLKKLSENAPKDGTVAATEKSFYSVKKIKNIYDRLEPQVIVSVQPSAHGLAVAAKKAYKFNCKVITVISDYALDKLYVRYGCDGYVVDNHEIKKEFKALKFNDEKIKVYGLAASIKFLVKNDREKMRKHFELPCRKTVILAEGSFGAKKIKKIFEHLIKTYKDINIVAIAGRNERLRMKFQKIKQKYSAENAYILGFTTELDKLLDVADAMICMPDVENINGAFLKGVPLISLKPVPSVAAENAEYLKRKNLAPCADTPQEAARQLDVILNDEKRREELIANITAHARKDAAKNIADYIYSLIEKPKDAEKSEKID